MSIVAKWSPISAAAELSLVLLLLSLYRTRRPCCRRKPPRDAGHSYTESLHLHNPAQVGVNAIHPVTSFAMLKYNSSLHWRCQTQSTFPRSPASAFVNSAVYDKSDISSVVKSQHRWSLRSCSRDSTVATLFWQVFLEPRATSASPQLRCRMTYRWSCDRSTM